MQKNLRSTHNRVWSGGFYMKSAQLAALELQLQLIGNERNKLAVGRLALGVGNGVSKKLLQSFQIPTIPRKLDGMADGALNARGRGGKRLCHLRIQNLCDGVDHIHIVDGN